MKTSCEVRPAEVLVMSNSEQGTSKVTRGMILGLIKNRDSIDEQIQALGTILTSNHVGMTESLVDAEGFPRLDVDVYQVRHARHKIICLQNDRKALSKEIENKLLALHEDARENEDDEIMDTSEPYSAPILTPIARVNLVTEGSPAFHAGLHVDDEILSVGSINSLNFTSLSDIGQLIQRCQGTVVNVSIVRNGTKMKLVLIPGPWAGNGLIGCNILPIESLDR